ncbi:hypothetical protein O9929_12335 [Vibrio lentus]|nr:hypothetical protein [Vibrio lentus]
MWCYFTYDLHSQQDSLIASTVIATITVVFTTSDGKPRASYSRKVHCSKRYRKNGARYQKPITIEDAGTIIESLVPWTAAGIYMASTPA